MFTIALSIVDVVKPKAANPTDRQKDDSSRKMKTIQHVLRGSLKSVAILIVEGRIRSEGFPF